MNVILPATLGGRLVVASPLVSARARVGADLRVGRPWEGAPVLDALVLVDVRLGKLPEVPRLAPPPLDGLPEGSSAD